MDNGMQVLRWYHGSIQRDDANAILSTTDTGTYLLRDKTSDRNSFALSVRTDNCVQHFVVVKTHSGQYLFKSTQQTYNSIEALVAHHKVSPLVSEEESTRLTEPKLKCIEEREISSLSWYHDSMGRDQAVTILSTTDYGTYLLRDKTSSNKKFVISVRAYAGVQHFVVVKTENDTYVLNNTNQSFDSLQDLVEHHSRLPLISDGESTQLLQPLPRCVELDSIGFTTESTDVEIRRSQNTPEAMQFQQTSQSDDKKKKYMTRCTFIVIGVVVFILACILALILSITLTICGTGWCKNGAVCENSVCICKDGWKGKYCHTDINECELPTLVCAGKCKNTEGTFRCACMEGFRLHSDGTSCIAANMIEMVRVPNMDEVFAPSMDGLQYMIHQGNRLEQNTKTRTTRQLPGNARSRRDLPPNDDVLFQRLNETYMDNITIHSTDCDIMLFHSQCSLTFQSEPRLCVSVELMVNKFLKGVPIQFDGQLPNLLNRIKIESATINLCDEAIYFRAVYDKDIKIIPKFVSLHDLVLHVSVVWPTRVYDIRMSGDWMLGDLRFRVDLTKENGDFKIVGSLLNLIDLDELIAATTDSFIPSRETEEAFREVNLNIVEVSHITLNARFTEFGYGATIGMTTRIESLGDITVDLTVNKMDGSAVAVYVAVFVQQVNLAVLVQTITGVDIGDVPIIGDFGLQNVGVIYSTESVSYPIMPFQSEMFEMLPAINSGLYLLFDAVLIQDVAPLKFYVAIEEENLRFRILSAVKPFAEDILENVLDGNTIELPPGFDLPEILGKTLEGLEYDTSLHQLSFQVTVPGRIQLIQTVMSIDNVTAVFTISVDSMSRLARHVGVRAVPRVYFSATGTWNLLVRSIQLRIEISKLPTQGYMGEISSPVQLSAYDILTAFSANELPTAYTLLLDEIGVNKFVVGYPYLRVLLNEDYVVQASGQVKVGRWVGVRGEVFYSSATNSKAYGLVTSFEKGIENLGRRDVLHIPGFAILKNTKFCIAVASHDIAGFGSTGPFQGFYSDGLSSLIVLQGLTIGIIFQVPDDCGIDEFCQLTQNVLGAGAAVVLQGTLTLTPAFRFLVYVALTNTNIEILQGLYLSNVGLRIDIQTGNAKIGFACEMELENPDLVLTGIIGVGFQGLFIEMAVQGFFPLIPTVDVVQLGDIHFTAAIGVSPIGLSHLGCGAKIKFGLVDNADAVLIEAGAYFGLGTYPATNYFKAEFGKTTIRTILAAFDYHPTLPNFITRTGFPDGLNMSFSPLGTVLPTDDVIPSGFRLEGTANILWFTVYCRIEASMNGILIDANATPFSIGRGLIAIGGRSRTEGPRLLVDASWMPPREPRILIEGYVSVLGMRAFVNITMNITGHSFYIEGSLWGLFEAHLLIKTSHGSIEDAPFEVEASMQQDLFRYLREGATDALNIYKQIADRAISTAQDKIDNARHWWDNAIGKLENARQRVRNGKQAFIDASAKVANARKKLDNAHEDLQYVKSQLTKAQNKIGNVQDKLDKEKEKLQRKKEKSCPSNPEKPKWYEAWKWPKYLALKTARELCKAAFWIAEKAVDAAKGVLHVAIGAVEIAKGFVDGARGAVYVAQGVLKAAEVLVLESRHIIGVATLAFDATIAVVDSSQIVLDAAVGFLEGVKHANRFGVEIINAVVQVALGGIFDITELHFSGKLELLDKSHISAYVGISWLGGPTQRYGFTLNLLSVPDMIEGLVEVLKQVVGVSRRRREIPYNFFGHIGPNTEKLFNTTGDLVFDDCRTNIKTGIYSVLEILYHMKNISHELEIQPHLMFYNQYQQDSVLAIDRPAMTDLDALYTDIDFALNKTILAKHMLTRQMQQMEDSGLSEKMMGVLMDDMSNTMTQLTSAMQHSQVAMQHSQDMTENSVNKFMEELERNISLSNPSNHSEETEANMNMVDSFIADISDGDFNDSVGIIDEIDAFYGDLDNTNENDTNALNAIRRRLNELNPILMNIGKHMEEQKLTEMHSALQILQMNEMMTENAETIMSAVERNRDRQMNTNITNQLIAWFEFDDSEMDNDTIDAMERTILIPIDEAAEEDEMMTHILDSNLNTSHDEPMHMVDNIESQLSGVNDDMRDVMGMMDNTIERMQRLRSKRDISDDRDDIQNSMDKMDSIQIRLETSRNMVNAIKENLLNGTGTLNNLQHHGVNEDFIETAKIQLNSLTVDKSAVDNITNEIACIQRAGVLSWLSLLDGNIAMSKNKSLLEFIHLLKEGIHRHTPQEVKDDLRRTLAEIQQFLLHVIDNTDAENNVMQAVNGGIYSLEKVPLHTSTLCKTKETAGNDANSPIPFHMLILPILLSHVV